MHPNTLSTGDGLTMTLASYVLLVNKKTSIDYRGTLPIMATFFQPGPAEQPYIFLLKKTMVNAVTH